ncbi:MAG: hypothetical protein K8R54_07920 [Bacteroidales bacterium]|nr:hypothetical protein [Bacteroidales bacterium]
MKEIIFEIRDFLKADFNIYAYLYTILFLTAALIFNYEYNFEDGYVDGYYMKPISYLIYPLYYITPYYIVVIPVLFIKKQQHKLLKTEFWVKSIIFFGTFGMMVAFWQYRPFIDFSKMNASETVFIHNLAFNLKRIIPFIIIFFAVKSFYDKEDNHLFGLRYKGMNYRPFFLMLILMIPLITLASYQPDFQKTYPQYKFWYYEGAFGMTPKQTMGVFELAYGLDFVSVELMYRGALIVGMAKVLGKEAVLPMAAAYVIIHFGKPAGEAVSSFFGGFILGVHALAKKNIFGGIIIHVGIAYIMEIAAVLQHFYG